jgi:hypothetical protein
MATDTIGSACIERFRRWAMDPAPAPRRLEELRAGVELYQPDDLPEMIEILREAERICMTELHEIRVRMPRDRSPRGARDTAQRLSDIIDAESHRRWGIRMQFLQELRHLLEAEPQGAGQRLDGSSP